MARGPLGARRFHTLFFSSVHDILTLPPPSRVNQKNSRESRKLALDSGKFWRSQTLLPAIFGLSLLVWKKNTKVNLIILIVGAQLRFPYQILHFCQHSSPENIIRIDIKIRLEVDYAKIKDQKSFINPKCDEEILSFQII